MFLNGISHKFSFVVVGHGTHQPDILTLLVVGPQFLWNLTLVISNDLIGHLQNILGASVILLQFDHFHFIVIFSEQKNILNGRSAESINGLCIITHHTYVFMGCTQQFYNFILSRVSILVLINHDMAELVLILVQSIRMMFQDQVKL